MSGKSNLGSALASDLQEKEVERCCEERLGLIVHAQRGDEPRACGLGRYSLGGDPEVAFEGLEVRPIVAGGRPYLCEGVDSAFAGGPSTCDRDSKHAARIEASSSEDRHAFRIAHGDCNCGLQALAKARREAVDVFHSGFRICVRDRDVEPRSAVVDLDRVARQEASQITEDGCARIERGLP
jgi:hypothetical protein